MVEDAGEEGEEVEGFSAGDRRMRPTKSRKWAVEDSESDEEAPAAAAGPSTRTRGAINSFKWRVADWAESEDEGGADEEDDDWEPAEESEQWRQQQRRQRQQQQQVPAAGGAGADGAGAGGTRRSERDPKPKTFHGGER